MHLMHPNYCQITTTCITCDGVCVYACVYTCVCVCVCVYVRVCMFVCMHMHVCVVSNQYCIVLMLTGSTMMYTAEELKRATKDYDEGAVIGKGGFGMVFAGKLRHCNVAIKR